jgi:hypothetical protein
MLLVCCCHVLLLQEIRVDSGKTYKTVSRCPVHYVLTHENKGFEGLHLHEHNDHSFLLGLCEGEQAAGVCFLVGAAVRASSGSHSVTAGERCG